jgi:hypothetical protein
MQKNKREKETKENEKEKICKNIFIYYYDRERRKSK